MFNTNANVFLANAPFWVRNGWGFESVSGGSMARGIKDFPQKLTLDALIVLKSGEEVYVMDLELTGRVSDLAGLERKVTEIYEKPEDVEEVFIDCDLLFTHQISQ